MANFQKYKKILEQDWYIQGFPATPLYLNLTGYSGFITSKSFPYKYTHFLIHYKRGYAEYNYDQEDFRKLWLKLKPKIFNNSEYLKNQKKLYLKKLKQYQVIYDQIDRLNFKKITDKKLLFYLNNCAWGQIYAGVISHQIIEPAGLEIEKEFKNNLLKKIGPVKNFNQIYSQLTAPTKASWVSKEEAELRKATKKQLGMHLRKYFWIRNSYDKAQSFTLEQLEKRWLKVKKEKVAAYNTRQIKLRKQKNIARYGLDKIIQKQINIIDFLSQWQDERKAYIFKGISYLDVILSEVSERVKIDKKLLYYLSTNEVLNINNFKALKTLKRELIKREKGCYFWISGMKHEDIITGAEYQKIAKAKNKIEQEKSSLEDSLHGSTANTGTAMGKVVICKNISHITKVQKGDVLVASMTRPEYMPAIKKAAAIVTDEGGITCHAAIVARELDIPCIIGTKNATKVLKDGMLVEVKANHGLVKIIQQKYVS